MIVVSVRSFLASILVFSVVYTCFILSGHKYSLAPITNKLNSFVAQLHSNYTLHDPVIALIPRHRNQTINDKQWKTSTGERLSNIVLASTGSSITEPSNNLITTLTLIPRNQTINDKLWNTTTGERISNTVLTSTGSSITEPIYNLSYLTSPNYTSAPLYQQINMTFTVNRELPFSSHQHTHVLDQEAVAERFRQRQARVQHVCRGRPHWTLPNTLRDWIYYAPKHNILVCVTPKIASSTWLTHLIHLRGLYPNVTNLHTNYWKNKIKARVLLGTKQLRRRVNSSVTIMSVRHPLSRLVSAFRDKFGGGNTLVKAMHPPKYRLFWRPALRALGKRKKAPIQFTFAEFLQFALYIRPTDRHWRSMAEICSPCSLSYQYILKLETFSEDLAYLAMKLNITRVISIHKRNNKKGESTTDGTRTVRPTTDHLTLDPAYLKYYLQLPPRLLANVIKKYKLDLELFGYKIPPALVNRTKI